LINNTGMDYI